MGKIKIIFFDFDGTISDAKRVSYESLVSVLERNGYKFSKSKARKLLGEKMHKIFKELKVPEDQISKIKKEFFKEMVKGVKQNKIKLCISVKPLIKLKEKYKLIVISNSESSFILASAKKLKVDKLFDKIYTAEDFTTKDEFLKKLFKKYKIKPDEAIYIGDRFSDIRYAKKAGCIAVAIHNKCSWSTLKEIIREKPDFLIRDFRGLQAICSRYS